VVWHNEHFGQVDDKEYQEVVTESHTRAACPLLAPIARARRSTEAFPQTR